MSVVIVVCMAFWAIAAILLLVRMSLGPTMLDRVIALDVMVAVIIGGLALEAAIDRDNTTLPILVVLSLLGFIGSVSVARFTQGSDDIEADHS